MDIDIRRGLAEARALAVEYWRPLLAYAGLGVVLPYLLLSSEPIFDLRTVMAMIAAPYAAQVSGSIAGPLYLLGIVAVLAAGAMLAAWNAILAEMREGYISEIMYGMVAGTAFLVGNILLYVGIGLLVLLPIIATIGIYEWNALAGGLISEAYRLLLSLLGTWIARAVPDGADHGAAGKLEPLSAFAQSWRLTREAQWRLFAFYFLYALLFGAAFGGLVLVHGAVIWNNAQEPGTLLETAMSFAWLALFAAWFVGQIVLAAGFLRAARPRVAASEVFA